MCTLVFSVVASCCKHPLHLCYHTTAGAVSFSSLLLSRVSIACAGLVCVVWCGMCGGIVLCDVVCLVWSVWCGMCGVVCLMWSVWWDSTVWSLLLSTYNVVVIALRLEEGIPGRQD